MFTLTHTKRVNAPKELVWEVMSEVGDYAKYATQLHHVEIESGDGLGMVRACSNEKGRWTETCTQWELNKGYTFEVNTHEKEFPLPMKEIKGTFKITEITPKACDITFEMQFEPQNKLMVFLIFPFIRKKQLKGLAEILENWYEEIINRQNNLKNAQAIKM